MTRESWAGSGVLPGALRAISQWTGKRSGPAPALALILLPSSRAQSYGIDRVAGNPDAADDGIPAAEAHLGFPVALAVDGAGDLCVADSLDSCVLEVDAAGVIATIAGRVDAHGIGSGDCGPASAARPGPPSGIARDGSGRIVIATPLSRPVRRLSVGTPASCGASLAALPAWTVSSGRVLCGGLSSRGCLTLGAPVSGISFLVHASEWRRRAPGASVGSAVGGTPRVGRRCALEPAEPGQRRAVAGISVGSRGRAGFRAAHAIAGPSVVADTGPSFGSASLSDQSDVSGPAINRLALPAATGGDSPLAYSLRPAAPGLPCNSQARQLSGTPTSPGTSSMRFSVRDSDGDAATLRFAIDTEPGAGTAGASRYSMGDRITTLPAGRWTPDVASGGSFQHSGGTAAVRLNSGGCIEEGDCRYTCASSGGARRSTAR